jgi:hypothetical protein
MIKRICVLLILVLVLFSNLPVSREAEAGIFIPDVLVEVNPGYVVLDSSLEEDPLGQVSCHFSNPSIHQVTVDATVSAPGFTVTPDAFAFTLSAGQEMEISIAVSAASGQVGRAVATVEVELSDQNGIPAIIPKTRTVTFLIVAPPFASLSVNPTEITVPGTGWYQRVLSIYNPQPVGQFYDIEIETSNIELNVEASSSRIFLGAREQVDYPILVWCGAGGAQGEMDIIFTPDYGRSQTITLGVGFEEAKQGIGSEEEASGSVAFLEPGLALALAGLLCLLMVLAKKTPERLRQRGAAFALAAILVLGPALFMLPGEAQGAGTMVVNPGALNVSQDQFFYEFEITVRNPEYYEQTFKLTVEGESYLFGYGWEWVVPAQDSFTRTLVVMKDFYPPAGPISMTVQIEITENEGIPVTPVPYQSYSAGQLNSAANIYFHGSLSSKDHMRVTPEGEDESIIVHVRTGDESGRAVLLTQNRQGKDWEVLDETTLPADETRAEIMFEIVADELKKGQPYRVELYRSENDAEPTQEINLVFDTEEERIDRVPMPEKDDSPGPGLLTLLLCVTVVALFRKKGRR